MKLLPEDLENYINHYVIYLATINRLENEILELEAQLNRLPGSIIKISNKFLKPLSKTRQIQLLFEIDQLSNDKLIYQKRVDIVNAAIDWERKNAEQFIIVHRANRQSYEQISFLEKQPKTTIIRSYKENISDFVNFWNNSKKNVI